MRKESRFPDTRHPSAEMGFPIPKEDPGGILVAGCGRVQGLPAPAFLQHPVDGGDIIPGKALTLVFAPENVAQGFQLFQGRKVVVSPLLFRAKFGLKTPSACKAFRPDFAFFPVGGDGFPDMDISHGGVAGMGVGVEPAKGYQLS